MKLDLDKLSDEEIHALGEHLRFSGQRTAVLADWTEGDVVSVEGRDSVGVVVSKMIETFDFPTSKTDDGDAETETLDASSDEPVFIVAFTRGGIMAVDGDRLSENSFDTDVSADDATKLARQAEEAAVYDYMDDPEGSAEALRVAKREYILDRHEAALADREAAQMSYEELVSVPGVDDPGVGFDSLPDGWTRATVLDAWASLGGTFTTCRAEMTGEIRSPSRFCAAFKDEVLRTELWRNRF